MARDLELAVMQLRDTILHQLVTVPPNKQPVRGLTFGLVDNLARTIAGALDEYGVEDAEEATR
jgi:hypothetical protein